MTTTEPARTRTSAPPDRPGPSARKGLGQRLWEARGPYLFMAPALVLAGMFTFYPMIASWRMAALDWSGIGDEPVFVGVQNFVEVLNDDYYWDAMGRTFLFAVVASLMKLALGLVIAIFLNNQALKMRAVFRTFFFLPVVTTAAVIGVVASLMMNPFDGPLNTILLDLGLIDRPIDFLGDPDTALWSVAGVWVWQGAGLTMVFWLVALQTVPSELYEAAAVDGAGRFRTQRSITLPLIKPFAMLISLLTIAGALQTFPLVQTMTQGGPNFATELVELYIYRLAFGDAEGSTRLGYASAVAVLFGLSVLLVTLAQAWGIRRVRLSTAYAPGRRRQG